MDGVLPLHGGQGLFARLGAVDVGGEAAAVSRLCNQMQQVIWAGSVAFLPRFKGLGGLGPSLGPGWVFYFCFFLVCFC